MAKLEEYFWSLGSSSFRAPSILPPLPTLTKRGRPIRFVEAFSPSKLTKVVPSCKLFGNNGHDDEILGGWKKLYRHGIIKPKLTCLGFQNNFRS